MAKVQKKQKKRSSGRNKIITLSILLLVLSLFISGCTVGSRVNSFFASGEFKQHAAIIDFILFFTIFFALCYLGLSMAFGKGFGKPGEAKGPIIGLSLALALVFAFAIVTQTSFSIMTMFPLAKTFLFIALWFVLWGLLSKSEMFGKHWGGKIVSAILAAIIIYLLACIFTHMVCQMSDNMDDPACRSDALNFLFNGLGRIFGIDSWTGAGGGGFWTSSSGSYGWSYTPIDYGSSGDTTKEKTGVSTTDSSTKLPSGESKEIQGGCRLDLTFTVNEYDKFTSSTPLEDYAKRVKQIDTTIYVYGFASWEGNQEKNSLLSGRRSNKVMYMLDDIDKELDISNKQRGRTKIFGAEDKESDYVNNRRVVITTEPLSGGNFLPAPSPGQITGCPEVGDATNTCTGKDEGDECGSGERCLFQQGSLVCVPECIHYSETRDTGQKCLPESNCETDSIDRALNCKSSFESIPDDIVCCKEKTKEEKEDEADESSTSKLWYLLLLFLLIPLLFAIKAKKSLNIKEAIKKKSQFQKDIDDIKKAKDDIRHLIAKPETAKKDEDAQKQTAWTMLESIESDLRKRKSLQQIAVDYTGREDDIAKETMLFGVDEQHARQIQRILLKMKSKGISPNAHNFRDELLNTVAEMISDHTLLKELHDFMHLQVRLKKHVQKFMKLEQKIMKYAEKSEKRKSILETTRNTILLCERLIEKIQEVLTIESIVMERYSDEENNKMWQKYSEEKAVITKLSQAVELQKKQLSKLSVAIIKPENGNHFHNNKQLKIIADVVNGNPPFKYQFFWGDGLSKVPLTGVQISNKSKIEMTIKDSFVNLHAPDKTPLLDRNFWADSKKDHFRLSIKLYDATNVSNHYDYAQDETIITVTETKQMEFQLMNNMQAGEKPAVIEPESPEKDPEEDKKQLKMHFMDAKTERQKKITALDEIDEVLEEGLKEDVQTENIDLQPKMDIHPTSEVPPATETPHKPEVEPEAISKEQAKRPPRPAPSRRDRTEKPSPADVNIRETVSIAEETKTEDKKAEKEEEKEEPPFLLVQGNPTEIMIDPETKKTKRIKTGNRISLPSLNTNIIRIGNNENFANIILENDPAPIHAVITRKKDKYTITTSKDTSPIIVSGGKNGYPDIITKDRKEFYSMKTTRNIQGAKKKSKRKLEYGDTIRISSDYVFIFSMT